MEVGSSHGGAAGQSLNTAGRRGMAEDSSNPLGLPPSVWIAVIVGVAGVFALNQHPFQDVRPADATAPVYRHTPSEDQDVEARLWEDPLGAAATAKAGDDREA